MVARCRGRAQVEMGVQKDVIVSETVDPGQAPVNQKLCNSRFSNVCNFLEKKNVSRHLWKNAILGNFVLCLEPF